jgi:hypothetical protein
MIKLRKSRRLRRVDNSILWKEWFAFVWASKASELPGWQPFTGSSERDKAYLAREVTEHLQV